MTRIAFVTGHEFGVRALQGILSSAAWHSGTISLPIVVGLGTERASRTVGYASPESLARAVGATAITTGDGSLRGLTPMLDAAAIDYLLVIGWSRLVPSEVLRSARREISGKPGAIGMHPTLLPIGRGRAPIPWTILKGLVSTGLTTFLLDEKADAGDILASHEIQVAPNETSTSLFYRIADLHFHAGQELADALANDALDPRPQDEALASVWEKRTPRDSEIRPDMTYADAQRLIRAQSFPYPGPFVSTDGLAETSVTAILRDQGQFPTEPGDWIEFRLADGHAWLRCADIVAAQQNARH